MAKPILVTFCTNCRGSLAYKHLGLRIYISRERERERGREKEKENKKQTRLSVTPGHRTVQEGLSMVSCRESITKSKPVLYWKRYSEFSPLRALSRPAWSA